MMPVRPGPIAAPFAALPAAETGTDQAVEAAVHSLLAESPVSKTAYISVAAQGGIVTLDGTVSDGAWLARFKNRLTAALPSVTIDDRLEWVVPDCGVGIA